MSKTKLFLFFMISALVFSAQDSLIKKSSNVTHLAGIDVGYSDYSGAYIKNNGETNIDYVFNPYLFCIKAQIGIAPATNYGNLSKFFFSMGFSTKIDKIISWHFLTGLGSVTPSVKYDIFYFRAMLFIEQGFYFKPFKNKRHVFGLNSLITTYDIVNGRYFYKYFSGNINISYNIKLNK